MPTSRTSRSALPTAAAAVLLLTAACASGPSGRDGSCGAPPEAVLPHTAGNLTETETGRYCLAVGEQLSVFLTAPEGHWAPVASSGPTVLTAVGSSMLTAPIGVTPALFRAESAGTVRLTSANGAGHDWQATVVVR
ncbi:hypothetical protein ACFYNO_09225 [Kitasatospora sp. NPDC006697]|uniref:hypothetical protein n=1 Tax=Kitasatospora sp. NPDC006697 TaxID=3364020 RepID=UPI00369260BD